MKIFLFNSYQITFRLIAFIFICNFLTTTTVLAQEPSNNLADSPTAADKESSPRAPTKVDVKPIAHDEEIQKRLQSILNATNWFINPRVRVEEGVVFLTGQAKTNELINWAGDLARNTQDVVAVVDQMEVLEPSVWDFSPARMGLLVLWRDIIRSLPFVAFALLTLAVFVGFGMLATRGSRAFLNRKIQAKLLRNAIARGIGILVVLLGIYLILRVSGLTQLALTVIGGTGLIGLALGIAFREISENFLASIFLSMQQPFKTGDLVEVSGVTGYVQQLNMRTTILMTLDGNLVQIPNATVYKSNLRNYTTNCNRREDFIVGIGYDDLINEAQEIARKVLANHPAVLKDPEPWVLADNLGQATINLRIYFWLNGREHSWLKVRSSVIRLVKRAFQEHGISMPDSSREVIFPQGVPVTIVEANKKEIGITRSEKPSSEESQEGSLDAVSTKAEVGLSSEASVIEKQAREIPSKDEENLLQASASTVSDKRKAKPKNKGK